MKNAFEYEAELVALRGELANAKEWSERLDKRCVALATDKDTLIDRCKAAEQRNAELVAELSARDDLLAELGCPFDPVSDLYVRKPSHENMVTSVLDAYRRATKRDKPAESGGAQ